MRRRLAALLLSLPALAACSEDDSTPTAQPGRATAAPLSHDYGVIPHGQTRTHTFELNGPEVQPGMFPAGFRASCSCSSARFWIRSSDGKKRNLEGLRPELKTLQRGETLLLELTLDTRLKEAVDLDPVTIRGAAVVRSAVDSNAEVALPIVFHYAIDAPVAVLPHAHVDFGQLPVSRVFSITLGLQPDPELGPVTFGPVSASDPRVTAKLREEEGETVLDVGFDPGPNAQPSTVQALLSVTTSVPDYTLPIPVSGQLISDVVVEPMDRVSFRVLPVGERAEVFVLVTDHDRQRPPEFVVESIVDHGGHSLADHFEVDLEPVEGQPRTTRVVLRYLGTLSPPGFRGVLRLGKPGGVGPRSEITFVGFHK